MILTKITSAGSKYFDVDIPWAFTTTVTSIAVFIFVLNMGLGTTTVFFINTAAHKVIYVHRYNVIKLRHEMFKSPDYLKQSSEEVFKLTWKNCRGYDEDTEFLNILSPALQNEILIDVSWPAFQHSKIFRNMDLPFLRHVSKYMKQTFILPNEFLIRKNEWKNKMIYVASGIIQLLSEEDGESPIMLLTSGTCIGESSLFLNYKSINSVRCQTFCELHILEKKDFLNVFRRFPTRYKTLQNVIADRYRYAKTTSALATTIKMNVEQSVRQTDIYTIFWIKNTLHRLMSRDAESTYRHEFQNIYLLNEVNEDKINKLLFTAIYLDMLVITERIQSDVDTIFVRTSFPCILQPISILIILWEVMVVSFAIFLAFAIPIFAFVKKHATAWYRPVLYIGTIIYWCDLYVQLSTSLRTRQGVYTKFKQIAIARMQSIGFWVDMCTCIPCEVFSSVVLSTITSQMRARLQLNRVLKLWRVIRLFKFWEEQFNANIIVIRFVKYTCIILYLSFILFSVLYSLEEIKRLKIIIFSTIQIMSTVGLSATEDKDNLYLYFFLVAHVTYTLVGIIFAASIASAFILKNLNLFKTQQTSYDLLKKIKAKKLYSKYNKRIIDYLITQWDDNRCYQFQTKMFSVIYISKLIYDETVDNAVGDTIRSLGFFKLFNNDLILDICGKLLLMSFPPNEIITHAGDIPKEMIISHIGCFEMISNDGRTIELIDEPRDINLLEVVFGLPNHNTCRTKTHCRIFKLNYRDFLQSLLKYPDQMARFNDIVACCDDIKERLIKTTRSNTEVILNSEAKTSSRCFYHFGYNLTIDSFEEYDYYIPFDRLYPFSWIRFFLQRSTILPNGKFLLIWEIFRSITTIISSLMFFTMSFLISNYNRLLDTFDIIALIDLYVRLHVCYYDENGLLIKHPLTTSIHYLKYGFLIDFIGILPLRYFSNANDSIYNYLLNTNKLLQLHRYLHLVYYLQSNVIKPSSKFLTLAHIPIILVLANICGTYLAFKDCVFAPGKQDKEFIELACTNESLLLHANIEKPIDKWRATFFGLYISTSVMMICGFQGYSIKSDLILYVLSALSIFGYYVIIIICGYVHTFFTFRPAYLLETQFLIKHLKKFLDLSHVSNELKTYAINSYELKWKKMKGQSIYLLMEPFSTALQTDVLYDYYGADMYEVSPFITKTKSFYRCLLLYMKHDIILKGGYLSTINDVEQKTYFVLKGFADILLPDGTKMVTIYPGSIFGNLEPVRRVRTRFSVVAMTHVQILSISGPDFQYVLNLNQPIKEEFCKLRRTYLTYIPTLVNPVEMARFLSSHASEYQNVYFLRSFHPLGKAIRIWKHLILIYPCYIGILLDLYQLATYEFNTITLAIQFSCDILYLSDFLLKDRIAYEDESGNMITDLQLIKQYNRKDKLKLWITLIALVPLDVVVYLMPLEIHLRNTLFSLFRLNRLFRLSYIIDYLTKKKKKLDVNAYVTRMTFIFFWASLTLIGLAAILGFMSCTHKGANIHPYIPTCREIGKMTALERFRLFTTYLYIVASCFTLTSQQNYYPQGTLHIIVFIAFFLIGQTLNIICVCQVFSVCYNMNIQKNRFKSIAERIFYYLETENVSASLMQRVKEYIQVAWSQQEGQIYSELLDAMPPYLQDAILNNAYHHILAYHPIFEHCHTDCLRQIIHSLKSRTYFSGDYIQFKGSIDESMYFILKGEVGVLHDESTHKDDYVRKLIPPNSFSVLQGLHYRKPHKYSFRCLTSSTILRLDFNDWEYLLSYFPASRERIFEAAKRYKDI
ncbi:Cyclic nucleotide-binding domain [Popillia japonica]|uniref:Cyclic nucleotide-binding domain n=2 Tax=Popillia japonica TaxID=7064 RepID=A0AAW1I9N1_POPJA